MTAKTLPASIRNKNPGAMWPGTSATKFGSKATAQLTDAQRNKMAVFPSHVQGAAAQFDLLLRLYCGKRLRDAIEMWSGQNHSDAYLAVLQREVGIKPTAVLKHEYILNPETSVPFAKAMAKHEAGQDYPMSDEEWYEAHALATDNGTATVATPHLEQFQEWLRDGVKEVPGAASNPVIDKMFLICGHPEGKFRDDTAWCAIAAYASVAMTGGYILSPNDGNTMAKSFLRWGVPVKEKDIRPGDFRVEDRGSDPRFGHVDVVEEVNHAAGTVTVIGGNVGNAVTRRIKSIKGARGYRRREDGPKPVKTVVRESPSIMMLLRGAIVAACAKVAEWVSDLPALSDHVTTTVNATKNVTESVGMSMSSKVLIAIAIVCAVSALCRMTANRQEDA